MKSGSVRKVSKPTHFQECEIQTTACTCARACTTARATFFESACLVRLTRLGLLCYGVIWYTAPQSSSPPHTVVP